MEIGTYADSNQQQGFSMKIEKKFNCVFDC